MPGPTYKHGVGAVRGPSVKPKVKKAIKVSKSRGVPSASYITPHSRHGSPSPVVSIPSATGKLGASTSSGGVAAQQVAAAKAKQLAKRQKARAAAQRIGQIRHDLVTAASKTTMSKSLPTLDAQQSKVASTVLAQGLKAGATKKELLSSMETGLQESGLRNLSGGDADSAGWRQERQSLYPNPTNVKASAKRYFNETAAAGHGRGMTPGQLSQAVQRSAYPGAYDPHAPQAKQIVNAADKPKPIPKAIKQKAKRVLGKAKEQKLIKVGKARATSGGGGGSAAKKAYANPFKKSGSYTQSRTDEGVDYTGTGAISAIGKGKYIGQGQGPGWASGGGGGSGYGVVYKLTSGPRKGAKVFLYEGISPAGKPLHPGDKIKKGQTIAAFTPGGSIEMGYSDRSGAPVNQSTYNEGDVTKGGVRFQKLLHSVGAASAPGATAISGSGSGATVVSTGSGVVESVTGATASGLPTAAAAAADPKVAKIRSDMLERRRKAAKAIAALRGKLTSSTTTSAPTAKSHSAPAPSRSSLGL